jgi:hypothetical protein
MIITLAFDTEFLADEMFRSLIERFFQSEITHTDIANQLNQQPEQISAMLGAIFIVALKQQNSFTRLNIFPQLTTGIPLSVEKAHLMAAGLPEDLAEKLLTILCQGRQRSLYIESCYKPSSAQSSES